jgi:hypothetical protein
VTVALVDEVVHLLGDDLGRTADAGEHAGVLEQRRDHLAVPRGLDHLGEHADEPPPSRRVRRKDVAHPRTGLELRHDA